MRWVQPTFGRLTIPRRRVPIPIDLPMPDDRPAPPSWRFAVLAAAGGAAFAALLAGLGLRSVRGGGGGGGAAGVAAFAALLAELELRSVRGVVWVDVAKGAIAATALAALAYERMRARAGRAVPPRSARRVGVALGAAAVAAYFSGAVYGWPG